MEPLNTSCIEVSKLLAAACGEIGSNHLLLLFIKTDYREMENIIRRLDIKINPEFLFSPRRLFFVVSDSSLSLFLSTHT